MSQNSLQPLSALEPCCCLVPVCADTRSRQLMVPGLQAGCTPCMRCTEHGWVLQNGLWGSKQEFHRVLLTWCPKTSACRVYRKQTWCFCLWGSAERNTWGCVCSQCVRQPHLEQEFSILFRSKAEKQNTMGKMHKATIFSEGTYCLTTCCLPAFSLLHACTAVITLTLPICNPCPSTSQAVLATCPEQRCAIQRALLGTWSKTGWKWSQWTLSFHMGM